VKVRSYKDEISLSYGNTHGDVKPENPYNDNKFEIKDCFNCDSKARSYSTEAYRLSLFYSDETILDKVFEKCTAAPVKLEEYRRNFLDEIEVTAAEET